jgi:hypothetical protein
MERALREAIEATMRQLGMTFRTVLAQERQRIVAAGLSAEAFNYAALVTLARATAITACSIVPPKPGSDTSAETDSKRVQRVCSAVLKAANRSLGFEPSHADELEKLLWSVERIGNA